VAGELLEALGVLRRKIRSQPDHHTALGGIEDKGVLRIALLLLSELCGSGGDEEDKRKQGGRNKAFHRFLPFISCVEIWRRGAPVPVSARRPTRRRPSRRFGAPRSR